MEKKEFQKEPGQVIDPREDKNQLPEHITKTRDKVVEATNGKGHFGMSKADKKLFDYGVKVRFRRSGGMAIEIEHA